MLFLLSNLFAVFFIRTTPRSILFGTYKEIAYTFWAKEPRPVVSEILNTPVSDFFKDN